MKTRHNEEFVRFFLVDFGDNEPSKFATAEDVATDIAHGQFDSREISQILDICPDIPPADVSDDMALRAWEIVAQDYEGDDTYIDKFIRSRVSDLDERIDELDQDYRDERAYVREVSSLDCRL